MLDKSRRREHMQLGPDSFVSWTDESSGNSKTGPRWYRKGLKDAGRVTAALKTLN